MSQVDVVVPCYNYARFLTRCIQSVLQQPGVVVRVLIIDDTSSDETPRIGKELAADPRVEFRRHVTNRGHIATYNEGFLVWASVSYSLLLSADDMLAPGALERATELMDTHPGNGMSFGLAMIITDDGAVELPPAPSSPEHRIVTAAEFLQRCCDVGNPVPTPTAVVRTKLQQQLGGYRADLPHTGDMEMWMRFAANSAIGVFRSVQAYYRWHPGNMSSRYYANLIGDRRERLLACSEILQRWGNKVPPQFERWMQQMRTRFATEALWIASNAFDGGDPESCRDCVEFDDGLVPGIRRSRAWWRLRVKRMLGPGKWQRIRSQPPAAAAAAPGLRQGHQIGWWPTESVPASAGSPS